MAPGELVHDGEGVRIENQALVAEIRSLHRELDRCERLFPQLGEFVPGIKSQACRLSFALVSVLERRREQTEKWGVQDHEPVLWSAILTEECGEFAQAALETRLGGPNASKLRDEAVDVAAVALQIIEAIDRQSDVPIDAATSRSDAEV